MASEKLTIMEACKRFGILRRQLENLIIQGMPCEGEEGARRIPWPEARAWRDQQFINLGKSYGAGKRTDAKERRAEADAELIELELAERRGELMTLAEGERILDAAFGRVRAKLLAFPHAAAMRITGDNLPLRIKEAQLLVDEIMSDLARADDVPRPDDL